MNKKLVRIIAAAILLAIATIIEHSTSLPTWQLLCIYLAPYIIVGYDVLGEALEGIVDRNPFDENFLMTVATIGALGIGFMPGAETEFAEAVFVMLFFQVGELFEHYAEHRSRKNISQLMDIRPDRANVVRNGKEEVTSPETVGVGEIIIVKPGERVPLDGIVTVGTSSLNTVALTGESQPRSIKEGDEIVSGCVNLQGVLQVKTTKSFGESTATKIVELVEHSSQNKSKSEAFIKKFARVYTPIVVYCALAVALLPPLFMGSFMESFPIWLGRALTFLVVSCPCALVISIPLTFFGGIGGASRHGILIKGGNYMDTLARTHTVVFDKTGTLTEGSFSVTAIHPETCSEEHLLHLAAHVERHSSHPIAVSLKEAFGHEEDGCKVEAVEELAGKGIRAQVNGQAVCVGNEKMMKAIGADCHSCHLTGTIVHVAIDGDYAGHIVISDQVKPDARKAISTLKQLGVAKTVMLTGDHQQVAGHIAQTLNVDEVHAELLPTDKVAEVERLLKEIPATGSLAFVGDGINDAPVLARADIGIAMGAMGADAAIEAADVVLMDDKPSKLALAIRIARQTIAIARQNVVFAIGIKVLVLILATIGLATMWMAVFADVGVMVLAVLNAMRALKV